MRRFVRNPKHREESNVRDEEKANSKMTAMRKKTAKKYAKKANGS